MLDPQHFTSCLALISAIKNLRLVATVNYSQTWSKRTKVNEMLHQPLQCRFHYFRCFHLDFKDGVYIYGLFMEGKDLLFVGAFGFGPNLQCNQASLMPGARWDSTSHLVPYRNCCLYDYHLMINFDSLVSLVSYLLVVSFVMIVAVCVVFDAAKVSILLSRYRNLSRKCSSLICLLCGFCPSRRLGVARRRQTEHTARTARMLVR